jgi:heat shock protein HtpX
VFQLGDAGLALWCDGRNGAFAVPAREGAITLALVPAGRVAAPRLSRAGDGIVIEFELPTGRPGLALSCRIHASPEELALLARHAHRAVNRRHAGGALGGMVVLLALCGFIIGGEHGLRSALTGSAPPPDAPALTPEAMRRLGARLLQPAEMPALFDLLRDICRRARLSRLPDLYVVAQPESMNAYALGGPEHAAIVVTEGLLRGMTFDEIAGILAHEVAHIRNNDTWAMTWAAALNRAVALASLEALGSLHERHGARALAGGPLAALLRGAPAISQLLCLALSRIREADADATALELIDGPHALVAALHKLEHHHATAAPPAPATPEGLRFLRSHPATGERVGLLMRLA